MRPNTTKAGTFEFRHPTWEGYGIAEWITVEGFGEGTEMKFDINIGKAVESYTVTFVAAAVPGDGDGGEEPATRPAGRKAQKQSQQATPHPHVPFRSDQCRC